MTDGLIKSSIEEIEWPAVPGPPGSALLAILFQLERSQWWPAEKLEEAQFGRLQRLLAHAQRAVLSRAPDGGARGAPEPLGPGSLAGYPGDSRQRTA